MKDESSRGEWSSKIGFILAAAGSAIGLGSIWRFPYIAGQSGGAAFVAVYLVLVFSIGISLMMAEIVIGKKGKLNAVGSFGKLGGRRWSLVGWGGVVAAFVILSYYGVIGGWTIAYIFKSFFGLMEVTGAGEVARVFQDFISSGTQMVFFQCLFMGATVFVVFRGVSGGIERLCTFCMPALFVLMLLLIGRSVTLPGAMEGVAFFLKPDFSKVTGEVFLSALGQAFFSLSLGIGAMIIYGSYLPEDSDIPKSSLQICFLTFLISLMAGLIIFPSLFAFGMEPGAGAGLTFITLPVVFSRMPGGVLWSASFFVLFFFAALTSSVSLLEVAVSYLIDSLGWARRRATIFLGCLITLVGIPSALSQGAVRINVFGLSFLDAADFFASNLIMPIVGFLISVFLGWVVPSVAEEGITNEGTRPFGGKKVWLFILRFVAPICILVIFIAGLKW
ncbi:MULTISPECIES: sodium-dependent transporter [Dethiosulfovibrio]|uniref:Transporter n=2 Tax=Dethiosulfovibrio TaxID=47054 RepID=A0ABS9ES73_9BACT|nr:MULTISPECIES: sodium-dependent transporter [Dethiosulfovibrio]MCF4114142.1 sodium-dependent transporter [Dethiosulfovibrio russensis]MCF4142668.1 sodium-dependent transporter [Dethiosulfovibrio marinus]MCF4144768.1 sodium-dependent transporter [Dethiosulfovibrio acidaminovorans]